MDYSEFFGGGGSLKIWQSGMTVAALQAIISPLDGEIYRRKTAAGGGATDPANDTINYFAVSYPRITALPTPGANARPGGGSIANFANGADKTVLTGISAGVRTQVLNLSGRGSLCFAAFLRTSGSVGAATRRFEVIVDGRTVMDATIVEPTTNLGQFQILVGAGAAAFDGSFLPAFYAMPQIELPFRRTCSIYQTSNVAEAGTTYFCYNFKGES